MAKSMRADWTAVYVEASFHSENKEKDLEAMAIQHLRLAERLGAETAILTGTDFAEEVLTYAQGQERHPDLDRQGAQTFLEKLIS